MSTKRDYYEILGVSRTASSDELRKAYRQLALKYHPDRNPGDASAEAIFKEVNEAYSVLSDEQKRAVYDQYGHAGLDGRGGADPGDIFSHFQDLFSEFFGGASSGRGRAAQRRGADVRVQERLSLKDAVLGCKREITVRAPAPCESCDGSGAARGTGRRNCTLCGGAGQVSTARGFVMFTQTCPRCRGQGSVVESPCDKCKGSGEQERTRKVTVTFPAGIDSGQRLRVAGQGMPGPAGAPPGDLYVDVELEPDPVFERDQNDLLIRLPISYTQAVLGARVPVQLLDGSVLEIDVPAGAQPNDVLTFKGKGVPRVDGRGRGALHAVVQVQIPRKISSKARQLLLQLEEELLPLNEPTSAKRVAP
ncbi:MAG: molecular chaperone DnaJ [Myxococcales bacterium]|nr:molecular chaperone DnaJ [Polyangiaceae bacterium]MDW8251697.1 molecular chaperone DnaJ [Myxococcales bacterium]